ncbi:hypothetical protein E1B28_005723 [Marasmius oreades]|uniref:Integral membrane family protein n=1 Tax=Marasmius oreades TaxID=181124 RepID=A0A9P7S429_9AGAR|nr:uncharacterized protein E1B28_005723 [Marasmius oreades]KAG7094917.1 hypothetical protein E1B28_005723 [Marasmius oreades]
MELPLIPLALASLLGIHGIRKKSLSLSGAATAFLVGLSVFAGHVRVFGVACVVFYLTGSRATKFGKQKKAKLEDGYHEAGYRSGWQVLSNAFSAVVACLLWNILFTPMSFQSRVLSRPGVRENLFDLLDAKPTEYDGDWCPIDRTIANGWSRTLVFAALGHFGCCLGDTLASELGILSKSRPILITTLKPVPPGTNGGMSVTGTVASITGGIVIGVTMSLCLIVENARCRESSIGIILDMVKWGAVAGGVGSLIDSFLGATVQQTRYNVDNKKILQDESVSKGPVKVISGWNVLTNNQVNVVSSIFTSLWICLM